ncbi:hypothetical protein BV22DRAFT_1026192, partial [Leucogyrophana mollusca]
MSTLRLADHFEVLEKLKLVAAPLLVSIATAIILHLLSNIPRNASNFLLLACRVIVTSTCAYVFKATDRKLGSSSAQSEVLKLLDMDDWPRDIRTALRPFHLDPDLALYTCC